MLDPRRVGAASPRRRGVAPHWVKFHSNDLNDANVSNDPNDLNDSNDPNDPNVSND